MTVTEFGLLQLRRNGHGDADLLESLLQYIEIQDQWVDDHQPHLREAGESLSSMYLQQDGNAPYLLITAPWDSPASHNEWIQSKENQDALVKLITPYLASESSIQLFHMEPAGSNRRLLLDDVFARTCFNVARLNIDRVNKAALEKEYQILEEELQSESSSRQVWSGWKIEDNEDGRATLVVFWDPAARSEKLDSFLERLEQEDTRSFKSICSETVCRL